MHPLNWLTKMPSKQLYYGLAATVLVLCIIGGIIWKDHRQSNAVADDITVVRTSVIGIAEAAQGYTYSGEVRGRYESQLAFQANGKIYKKECRTGQCNKRWRCADAD